MITERYTPLHSARGGSGNIRQRACTAQGSRPHSHSAHVHLFGSEGCDSLRDMMHVGMGAFLNRSHLPYRSFFLPFTAPSDCRRQVRLALNRSSILFSFGLCQLHHLHLLSLATSTLVWKHSRLISIHPHGTPLYRLQPRLFTSSLLSFNSVFSFASTSIFDIFYQDQRYLSIS